MTALDFNSAGVVLGPPQCGKTTVVLQRAYKHLTTYPTGLVLAHDPNRQFRELCVMYEDATAYRRAFERACGTREPFPRGASIGGEADDVRELAIDIGRGINTAGNVRVPIQLPYDESSLLASSGSTHTGKRERALLSNRRHWGIEPIYNAQTAAALEAAFFALSTFVIMFRQTSERETAKLEERLGLRPGALRFLVDAKRFAHKLWEAGKGLV